MIAAAWVQAISTVVLVIITIFYVLYTKSLTQSGKEPILFIRNPSVLNTLFQIEVYNQSDFFAKEVSLTYIFESGDKLSFDGEKILFPMKGISRHKIIFSVIQQPIFELNEGDKIKIECKSILGKKTTQLWEYKNSGETQNGYSQHRFFLIDIF